MAKRLNIREIMPQLLASAQPRKARMLRVECQHKRAVDMTWRRRWTWRRRRAHDFADEIRSHIDLETERLVDEGMTPEAARLAARRRFGNPAAAAERFYESRRLLWLDHLWQDVRSAARNLAKCPVACAEAGAISPYPPAPNTVTPYPPCVTVTTFSEKLAITRFKSGISNT